MAALPEMVVHIRPTEVILDAYDAGILSDFGGGNVEWWQDYIRAELGRAHEFYQVQLSAPSPAATVAEGVASAQDRIAYLEGYCEESDKFQAHLVQKLEAIRSVLAINDTAKLEMIAAQRSTPPRSDRAPSGPADARVRAAEQAVIKAARELHWAVGKVNILDCQEYLHALWNAVETLSSEVKP